MSFKKKFRKCLQEDIDDLRTLYRKGGSDKRHHNAVTGSERLHQQFIPTVHTADGGNNNAIEHLRKAESGSHVCSPSDLVHIINTYIKQGRQEPCNVQNVSQMASKYLGQGKSLGTTGMTVTHVPGNNTYILKK